MKNSNSKGVTLIALIVTSIVLVILAGVAFNTVRQDGIIDKSVKAEFMHNFRTVQESTEMYERAKKMQEEIDKGSSRSRSSQSRAGKQENSALRRLPVSEKLTDEEKTAIPTLVETIKLLNEEKVIEDVNLYWIDLELLNLDMRNRYIIDVDTLQIYDYEGEHFSGKIWHTIETGAIATEDGIKAELVPDEMWDGWITLNLYYPDGATEKMWRLSEEGETRYDENLEWESYTGPITVRLSEVQNIWIKYKIDDEEVIIPPLGKLLVDIQVSPRGGKRESVTVKINYDKDASTKQYRINGGAWHDYEGEFEITENVLIEAKGVKVEEVFDEEGNVITTQKITGKDAYYITNIGVEETTESLPAPTIERLEPEEEGEVARVKITYPENAKEKLYKVNYGKSQTYKNEISVEKYGTEIIAYYKTADGKISNYSYIWINDPNEGTPNPPGSPPKPGGGGQIPQPTDVLDGPTINISSNGEQATITLKTAELARKIYIQLGNSAYVEYTDPVTVHENMTVRAYYISELEGEISRTSYARVSGLHQGNRPSVVIDADPYPYGNNDLAENPVTVTITTDAPIAEYSYDGIVYETYTGAITVTKNCRIYARGINDYGTTVDYLDITNISNTPPAKKEKLAVSINVSPEPSMTTTQIATAKVSIDYDEKATGKYYSIGKYGEKQEYTGTFEVTNNCTIYAYAVSSNGNGETHKVVDHLTTGIAEPIIVGNPSNGKSSGKTKITITFDKTAKTKRYEINGGGLRDYAGEFYVEENCVIRAVNTNSLGHTAETTYSVSNIVPEPPKMLLDRGDYYLLKLPFPEIAKDPEYKFKEDGQWKDYDEIGIVLIKPEKQEEFEGKEIIEIIDEAGDKKKVSKEHCYVLDIPISQLFEHISMRWDRSTPSAPQIILSTTDPAREVTATIKYADTLVKKEYRIMTPDGVLGEWKEYSKPLQIKQKNTVIYARGQDEAEVFSETAILKVQNIDEEPPIIKLTADLETSMRQVGIRAEVTDDVKVEEVKWAQGIRGESYFEDSGNPINNNSVFEVSENGYYTIFAVDGVGNTSTSTIQVENVDRNAPDIEITTDTNEFGIETNITIDYGDSTTKQYKIGASNTKWTTYTDVINLTSNTVLANGWANDDNTVTIYAKGTDSAGNVKEVSKKILTLDLDAPAMPIINSNYGYPVLTEYGVTIDGATTITYDAKEGIKNVYSIDNGTTWQVYTGAFNMPGAGTIIAKSIKASGLETIATATVGSPADALGPAAYDENEETSVSMSRSTSKEVATTYISVESNMWNKEIYCYAYCKALTQIYVYFYDDNGFMSSGILCKAVDGKSGNHEGTYKIPEGATKIGFARYNTSSGNIIELGPNN